MRTWLQLAAALALAAGCSGRRPADTEARRPDPLELARRSPPAPNPNAADRAGPAHQDRGPREWAGLLNGRDPKARQEAGLALGELKEDGFPHLFKAMQSDSAELRLTAMKSVQPQVLVAHGKEAMPLLLRLVNDPDAFVRRQAAAMLGWFGKGGQQALPALEAAAQNDGDPQVRRVAKEAAFTIKEAQSGTLRPDR